MFNCRLRLLRVLGLCLFAGFYAAGDPLSLSITNNGENLVLCWPAWANDAVLEQSAGLHPPVWSIISRAFYESNSAGFSYRFSALEESRYFRVRRLGAVVPGLTAYWSLDEGTGVVAEDQSGSGRTLNLTNTGFAAGRFGAGSASFNGQALEAGGSLAWVSNTNYQVLPPVQRPFSVSLWFSPDAWGTGSQPILGTAANATNGWNVALNTPGPGTNELILGGALNGISLSVTGRTLLLPRQWHRLLVTSESNQAKLFLDSSLLAEGPLVLNNHEGPLYFGGLPGSSGFLGRIDEIRTYTNAVTAEQISVTGEWHFDENAGGLAADNSIQGYLATVTGSEAWVGGKAGRGIDLVRGSVSIANQDFRVLPASGGAVSVSAWLCPRELPDGRIGLFNCTDGTKGWQFGMNVENSGDSWLEFTSTNLGGTLGLRAPFNFVNGAWTKLDLTYNGGMAAIYVNGKKVGSGSGAIRGCAAPFIAGVVSGATNFQCVLDDLKIYNRERGESEVGPLALPMWEMALLNTSTNLVLQGSGPPGKALTYTLLSNPTRGTISYSPSSPIITYHAGAQKGPDSFVYTVSDGEFTSPPATGAVSVVQAHWLSPGGGALEPRDGSSPEAAWVVPSANVLDQIWHTNGYYDCFFYAPGEYETTGWKWLERSTANPGCKHIGSGAEGPGASIIKLVNAWKTHEEGVIFNTLFGELYSDDFEVHNLVLNCNATNNPKHLLGEPVWLRIPLTATGWVNEVRLHWGDKIIPGNGSWKIGRPAEFSLCTLTAGTNSVTNCLMVNSTSLVDVVTVSNVADELLIQLTRRANGVDYYALQEVEVPGAAVSLPRATRLDGIESRLDAQHPIVFVADQNAGTSWASGPESQVQIFLPLEPGTGVSQLEFQWNCQTLPDLRRLGPAVQFVISARDPATGEWRDVPFVTSARSAAGGQMVTFTNTIVTDQLMILLTAREGGVDSYSLREINLLRGSAPVSMRLPKAMSELVWDAHYSILRAFDGNEQTGWASDSQGQISAISMCGSNLKFTGLKIIGFGTKAGRECFPLAVLAREPSANIPPVRNVLVQDCVFAQPAPNNKDGLTTVAVAGPGSQSVFNARIRRCSVIGVAPHFAYSQGFTCNFVENCYVEDCGVGVYFEPTIVRSQGFDSIGPVTIRSNLFNNVGHGLYLNFHAGAHFDSLVCDGNEIVLAGVRSVSYGIAACDACVEGIPGTITNFVALNNIIRYPNWVPRPSAIALGLYYGDFQHAVYANNVLALGSASSLCVRQYPAGLLREPTTPEDCDHPGIVPPGNTTYPASLDVLPPGYRRAWYNNRDLSGALLPVGYRVSGADRLAAQQQWPE